MLPGSLRAQIPARLSWLRITEDLPPIDLELSWRPSLAPAAVSLLAEAARGLAFDRR
jgi:hypothetical protein